MMSSVCSSKMMDDNMEEDDDKDDTKRKTRNLSEKRRRDQFSTLVNELGNMVSTNNRKMDKSTVLRATIAFLKNHNESVVRNKAHEISEDFKPNFISNDEYLHILLDALDGFLITFSSNGNILYSSYSICSLLGYLQTDLINASIYDLVIEEDHQIIFDILRTPFMDTCAKYNGFQAGDNEICFECRIKRGDGFRKTSNYEKVQIYGHYRMENNVNQGGISSTTDPFNSCTSQDESGWIFICKGLLQNSLLLRELAIADLAGSEFTSRHSLEWKFIYLDQRAPPIIGYLPFELLGTSGYEYYHIDDLENVSACHEKLMQKGEGTTCLYRFLTKGQQWIWLQTRSYITYHQWNSKPEFVVCTNRVVGYPEVIKQLKSEQEIKKLPEIKQSNKSVLQTEASQSGQSNCLVTNTLWPVKSSAMYQDVVMQNSPACPMQCRPNPPSTSLQRGPESEAASISVESPGSLRSIKTNHSNRPPSNMTSKCFPASSMLPVDNSPHNPLLNQVNQSPSLFVEPQYIASAPTPNEFSNQPLEDQLPISDVSTQVNAQFQLQRKQEELQQTIQQHQEELRRISEQLAAVSYGFVNSQADYNSGMQIPYTMAGTVSSTTNCFPSTDQYLQQILPQDALTLDQEQYQPIPYDEQYTGDIGEMGYLVYQDQTSLGDLCSYQLPTQLLFDDSVTGTQGHQ